ncbi:hypothetical protein T492DRAFT_935702, partial [Pavlovales sp. CCMP2436]
MASNGRLTSLEQLDARVAAAKLDPRFQHSAAGGGSVFLASGRADSRHAKEAVGPSPAGRLSLGRYGSRDGRGEAAREPRKQPTLTGEMDLVAASKALASKLDALSLQLAATAEGALDDDVIAELASALQTHAGLSREALEREQEARIRERVGLEIDLKWGQAELEKHRKTEAVRTAAAVEAERKRCHAEAAVNLADSLFAAEIRWEDESVQLQARHAREISALKVSAATVRPA